MYKIIRNFQIHFCQTPNSLFCHNLANFENKKLVSNMWMGDTTIFTDIRERKNSPESRLASAPGNFSCCQGPVTRDAKLVPSQPDDWPSCDRCDCFPPLVVWEYLRRVVGPGFLWGGAIEKRGALGCHGGKEYLWRRRIWSVWLAAMVQTTLNWKAMVNVSGWRGFGGFQTDL